MYRRPRRRDEPAMTGNVVGVRMGLENVLDLDAEVGGEFQIFVNLEAWIDDCGYASMRIADEVRRTAKVVVG